MLPPYLPEYQTAILEIIVPTHLEDPIVGEGHAIKCVSLYLDEDSVFTGRVKGRIVTMLHGQAPVDVETWHEVGLAGFRVFEALAD